MTFEVGQGMEWWITRNADNASTATANSGNPYIATLTGGGTSAYNWRLYGIFPDPPGRSTPLQSREFRINANRAEHQFTVWMSDGYSTRFVPIHAETTFTEWNGQFIWNPLTVITFTASIDLSSIWWLVDNSTDEVFPIGQTDIFDGWEPQYDPPYDPFSTITIHLPSWGLVSSASIRQIGSSDQIFPSNGFSESTTYEGVDGMVDFTIDGGVMEFIIPIRANTRSSCWVEVLTPGSDPFTRVRTTFVSNSVVPSRSTSTSQAHAGITNWLSAIPMVTASRLRSTRCKAT
jgi:hypothetical protein